MEHGKSLRLLWFTEFWVLLSERLCRILNRMTIKCSDIK